MANALKATIGFVGGGTLDVDAEFDSVVNTLAMPQGQLWHKFSPKATSSGPGRQVAVNPSAVAFVDAWSEDGV